MDLEMLFGATNSLALIAWIALIVAPYHKTVRISVFGGVVVFLGLCYSVLLFYTLDAEMVSDMSTLSGLTGLFASEKAVLLGWIHYLAFDLVAGLYITKNAKENQLNKRLLLPFLIGTFMAGPFGFTAYIAYRSLVRKHYQF